MFLKNHNHCACDLMNVLTKCFFELFTTQQELRGRLDAAVEQADALRKRLQGRDTENTNLEQRIQEVAKESQEARRALEEALRNSSSRSRRSLELVSRYLPVSTMLMWLMFSIFPAFGVRTVILGRMHKL